LTFGSSGFSSKFFGSHTHTSAIAGQFLVYTLKFSVDRYHRCTQSLPLFWCGHPFLFCPVFLASRETCLEIFIFFKEIVPVKIPVAWPYMVTTWPFVFLSELLCDRLRSYYWRFLHQTVCHWWCCCQIRQWVFSFS
jgi:hypothetical protein